MKKITVIILSLLLVSASTNLSAQRASGTDVDYEYYRLPIQKVDTKKFHFAIEIGYVADYEADMAFYNEAHDAYDAIIKEMNDAYDKALEEYNSQSTGDKIAQRMLLKDDGKPKQPTNKDYADRLNSKYKHFVGPAPDYNLESPERNDIPSKSDLTSGISIDEFSKSSSSGIKIVIDATDYDLASQIKTQGEAPNERTYSKFTVSAELMITVFDANGAEIYTNSYNRKLPFESEKKASGKKWKTYENSSAYKNLPNGYKRTLISGLVKSANIDLNNQFGYTWIKKKSKIYTAKGKKFDYSELDKAIVDFENGLRDLKINQDIANEKFNKAIEIWNKDLEEMDTKNKKARINNKVGAALYINLGLAYTLMNDFDNADKALSTVQSNKDFKGGDIKEADAVRKFMSDQRVRASN
tara:strand:- start:121 stop:1356 length:1236 start_codon:yes stop_codon:yes gene_type:complete